MSKQRGFGLIVYALIALAVLGALGGIYAAGYNAGSTSKQSEWDEASRQQRDRETQQANAAAGGLERTRVKAKIVYRDITKTVDRIVDRPVYRNVCLDDDGLRLANAAIRGEGPDPAKPDPAMPGLAPPGERPRGLRLKVDHGNRGGLPGLLLQAQSPG